MRERLEAVFRAALTALDPAVTTEAAVRALLPAGSVTIAAVGKAAAGMARGAARALGPRLAEGLVVVPEHSHVQAPLRAFDAAHPFPDERSVRAGRLLLSLAANARTDHLLALVSGGASSLAVAPADGLTLEEKVSAIAALMAAGASIGEINTVRKHLSSIKGGQLAAATTAAVTTLVSSDVVGDDPSVVGSGPTVPDESTFAEALAIVRRARISVSPAVISRLERGARGELAETPSQPRVGDQVHVVAGLGALAAAAAHAAGPGARVVATDLVGDVGKAATRIQAWVKDAALDRVLVACGEPTIALPSSPGCGGRAHHLALLVAQAIEGTGATVLVAGSDGIDGNTEAAGAVVDGGTAPRLRARGIDPGQALARADAGAALASIGATVVTGRTGVNHADLVLAVVQSGRV